MSLDREPARNPLPSALLGEIIGLPVRITHASGVQPLPLDGTIVDESLRTLLVRRRGASRPRRIPKEGLRGVLVKDGDEVPLVGEVLRMRPEDRTKVLASGGRRRLR